MVPFRGREIGIREDCQDYLSARVEVKKRYVIWGDGNDYGNVLVNEGLPLV